MGRRPAPVPSPLYHLSSAADLGRGYRACNLLQPRLSVARPCIDSLTTSLSFISLRNCKAIQVRHASHAAQGRANGPTDSAGRRLGSKKSNTEHVVPGNIIFKQRGSKWHPGENVGMGRDHTIYALEEGYVRYYRNPRLHPTRKYIGVALAKEGRASVLPTPPNAPTRRRVGMMAVPMRAPASQQAAEDFLEAHVTGNSKPTGGKGKGLKPSPATPTDPPIMRTNGYRIANIQLARDAEKNEVVVRPYLRKDRWYAWRQRTRKFKEKKMARAAVGGKKRAQQSSKGKKGKK